MMNLSLDFTNIGDTANIQMDIEARLYDLVESLSLPDWWIAGYEKLEIRKEIRRLLIMADKYREDYG